MSEAMWKCADCQTIVLWSIKRCTKCNRRRRPICGVIQFQPRLSNDAKTMAGWFGQRGSDRLDFTMERFRPSDRAQAALDELVLCGMISRQMLNATGGFRYVRIADCREWTRWLAFNRDAAKFPIYEPIRAPIPEKVI